MLLLEQAKAACPAHRLRAIAHSQFGEDTAHMAFDGIERHDKRLSNLLIGGALCQQAEHLPFARSTGQAAGAALQAGLSRFAVQRNISTFLCYQTAL